MVLGHDLSEGKRTQDVRISSNVSFDTMLLRTPTLKGLKKAGFLTPSPVQLHGIPLGKCGFDLLLEAKSGTGKTAVFTVIALEKLDLNLGVQTIILAPTREIASQISDVIIALGSRYKDLNVAVVMGGLPYKEDVEKFKSNIHIVVGSPGRLRHLIQEKHIDVSSVRLFVFDEADKLMDSSFQPDINYIFSLLPEQKQVIMSSATYPADTKLFIQKYVLKAQHVCPDTNSVLLGIEQKVTIVPKHCNIVKQTTNRYEELKKILAGTQFKQCLIFCNYQTRVGEIHRMLTRDKWPVEQLYGKQVQTDRLDALKTLQEYKCRILVSTDLAARGIDASNVDIVINFEPPTEWQVYLHRIGRAGRYGSYGMAITILSEGKEMTKFKETLGLINIPFNLRGFWNDQPFDLSLKITDDSTDDVTSVMKSQINDEKREDPLKNVLTTESSEEKDSNRPEFYSFEGLCDSFKLSSKSKIETFSELMNSFEVNKNKDSKKKSKFEYKHVKVVTIPQVNKNLNESEAHKTNNICDPSSGESLESQLDPKSECNKLKELSASEKTQSSKSMKIMTTEQQSNCKLNMPVENIKIITCNEFDEADLQESFNQNQGSSNRKQPVDTQTDPMEQALLDAGLPTAFGKPTYKNNDFYKPYKSTSNSCNNDANIKLEELQCKPLKSENDNRKEIKSNANIAPNYKKGKDHNNYSNKTHNISYNSCNNDANIKLDELQWKPLKSQNDNRKEIKSNANKASHNKKEKYHQICSPIINVAERDQSEPLSDTDEETKNSPETSSETSSDEQPNNKNNYLRYASTTNDHFHQSSKKYGKSQAQKRNNQFDLWYNQLKHQMHHIQYALYIEELRKLCSK